MDKIVLSLFKISLTWTKRNYQIFILGTIIDRRSQNLTIFILQFHKTCSSLSNLDITVK